MKKDAAALKDLYNALLEMQSYVGGPNPLTSLALFSLLGAGSGIIASKLIKLLAPEYYSEKTAVRLPIIAALLAASPTVILDLIPNVKEKGLKGLIEPSGFQQLEKKSSSVDVDSWASLVYADPYLSDEAKAKAAIPVIAAGLRKNSPVVTPYDVGQVALQAGLGKLTGNLLGILGSKLLGLNDKFVKDMQRSGTIAGLIKALPNV